MLVNGMGGIGKTQICKTLYQEYLSQKGKETFSHIGYFTYDTDLETTLVKGMGINMSSDMEENKIAAWRKLIDLSKTGHILLFVDNYNNSLQDDPGMERLCRLQGTLVISSRRKDLGDCFKPYPIAFLPMEECQEIYRKIQKGGGRIVREEDTESLSYIVKELAGFHTITMELLSFLARTKNWTAGKLKQELTDKGFRMQFHKSGKLINIQESYEILYDMSELSEAEKNILEAFSAFPYLPLPFEILNRWLLDDAGASEDDDVIEGLYQKGWLQFYEEQPGYAMHPVFARFIYDKCKPSFRTHRGLIKGCYDDMAIPQDGRILECQKYLPFALALRDKMNIDQADVWRAFSGGISKLFTYAGIYGSAEKILTEVKQSCEKDLGKNHESAAGIYNNLAYVYDKQGKYEEAEELYEKALKIYEGVLGENHLSTAISYNNLASVYDNQGRYEKAEELYKKVLKISEEVSGENHPDAARSYNNLANIYDKQGRYKEAEALYEKALKTDEEVLGENHPDNARSYNNLAGVYDKQGKYKEAEALYKKALMILEEVLGENHPDTATGYNNLASVYNEQGSYGEAEELCKKALMILEKVLGENHPNIAVIYNNLANIYAKQEKYEEAERLLQKVPKK